MSYPTAGDPVACRRPRAFEIGAEDFLLDGQPLVIRCGEIHFARVPRAYWRHRLQASRAMGLNAVCAYLFWNFHEPAPGRFEWQGRADVAEFCRLAQEEGLWVILRPGPYSCAEWEMGGLPWWLLRDPSIRLRSTDPQFMEPAVTYLREVGRVLADQQVTRGGPVLLVQVENEYGSYGSDGDYLGRLRAALIEAGFEVPLFACNPPEVIANGYRGDLFQVVNFGVGRAVEAFRALKEVQRSGPSMNGEYYPAWFDVWGKRHHTGAIAPIVADLDYMLSRRHSFSIYMAHGGTSFGFWSGADRPFNPDTTSYDYDAPISEAGWLTPKFDAIRSVIQKHLSPGEVLPPPPAANPVIRLPRFELTERAAVMGALPVPRFAEHPLTMESLNQGQGCVVYSTLLPPGPAATLEFSAVHDFGWLYLDGELVAWIDRRRQNWTVPVPVRSKAQTLELLVEAMGRVNFGTEMHDRKGLHGPVRLVAPSGERTLTGWNHHGLPLDRDYLESLAFDRRASHWERGPAFWRGEVAVSARGDTFLDLRGWGKGVVWVNGACLGRFWNIGPSQTLYLPAPWLREGKNHVVVLDLMGPSEPSMAGLDHPILDELRPDLEWASTPHRGGSFVNDPTASSGSVPLRLSRTSRNPAQSPSDEVSSCRP